MKRDSSRRRFLQDVSAGIAVASAAAAAPLVGCATRRSDQSLDSGSPERDVGQRDVGQRDVGLADQRGSEDNPPATTGYFHDARMGEHRHSFERAERLVAIDQRLRAASFFDELVPLEPHADPLTHVRRVHSEAHVEAIRALPETGPAAALAVAGVLGAVDAVFADSKVRRAFCAVRPPGHHVSDDLGEEGFCYYGNVAIAARYAQAVHGIERVMIVDWDYHHGNGTEWAFYDDPSVLFFSTHNRSDYPGTGDPSRQGEGKGKGFNINVDLPCQTDDAAILAAFDDELLPAATTFRPQLVLVSAGFDAKQRDDLGCFEVSATGFGRLTEKVITIAEAHADGKIVSVLEGGYADDGEPIDRIESYAGLAAAAEAHVATLIRGVAS